MATTKALRTLGRVAGGTANVVEVGVLSQELFEVYEDEGFEGVLHRSELEAAGFAGAYHGGVAAMAAVTARASNPWATVGWTVAGAVIGEQGSEYAYEEFFTPFLEEALKRSCTATRRDCGGEEYW